jgi:hypothetical protein
MSRDEEGCYSRVVPAESTLSQVVDMTKRWMKGCDKFHKLCSIPIAPQLPIRVLDLGASRSDGGIKLIISNERRGQYIALSHRWGTAQTTTTTTSTNLPAQLKDIPWESLPKVFQDAVLLCRALEIRYMWIDALCIIQDDPQDWLSEAPKMAEVYSNAFLAIAATSCSDNQTSLFRPRWTQLRDSDGNYRRFSTATVPLSYPGQSLFVRPKLHLAHERFINLSNAKEHIADSPLLTRAWVFQERLLAPRTLHFHSEELVWECKEDMRCECGYLDYDELRWSDDNRHVQSVTKWPRLTNGWLKSFVAGSLKGESLGPVWRDIVSEFTQLDITYEDDRLPALAGIASRFADTQSLGSYLAGIWEEDLAAGLLFETIHEDRNMEDHSSLGHVAASWSWTSINLQGSTAVSYLITLTQEISSSQELSLVETKVDTIGGSPFGSIASATLTVRGWFCDCTSLLSTCTRVVDGFTKCPDFIKPAFLDDARFLIEPDSQLFYLYIGHQGECKAGEYSYITASEHDDRVKYLGLVLREASKVGRTYQRVGVLIHYDKCWKDRYNATVQEVVLV